MKKNPDFSIYSNLKQPQLQNCDSSNTTTHVNYNMPKSKNYNYNGSLQITPPNTMMMCVISL